MVGGIHPGHCAVVYNDGAVDDLFPPTEGGLSTFMEKTNSALKGLCVQRQASHMLQITSDVEESLLYNKTIFNKSSHPPSPLVISPSTWIHLNISLLVRIML